jgi:hypothetical protein
MDTLFGFERSSGDTILKVERQGKARTHRSRLGLLLVAREMK